MQKIYFNGKIITMKTEEETAEAVLTRDGRIAAVGTLDEIKAAAGDAEYYDLAGKTMLPAFIDPHSHISTLASNLAKADLSEARSFEDIVNILTEFKERSGISEGDYILGFGYDQNRLAEKRHPDKFLLDRVSRDNPIYISHVSLHMGVANSTALALAGITSDTTMPRELMGRLPDGEPSGYFAEYGLAPIYGVMMNQKLDLPVLFQKAQQVYLKHGISTVQDGAVGKDQFEDLKKLASEGVLELDTVAYLMLSDSAHETAQKNRNMLDHYENHLKIGGYKLVLDGSPQGKTAWLSRPYTDGTNGSSLMKDEQVDSLVKQAVEDNVQLIVHCNGDAASEQLLNSYERVLAESQNPNKLNLRPVMIHSQTVRRDQLERFRDVNMMPSFFVDHVYYWGDTHLKNLGKERADNISPVGWAIDLGLPYTFHQDTPVLQPDMLRTIRSAAERTSEGGVELGRQHRVSIYEVLKAITIYAAYQYGEESSKGTIERGKLADFVILDRNPLETPVKELTDITVEATILRDKEYYRANR